MELTAFEASVLALITQYPDGKETQSLREQLTGEARRLADAVLASKLGKTSKG